MEELFVLSLR